MTCDRLLLLLLLHVAAPLAVQQQPCHAGLVCRPHATRPSFQPLCSGMMPQLTFDKATCNLSHSPKPVTYTALLLATAAPVNALRVAANFQKSLPTDPTADGKRARGA